MPSDENTKQRQHTQNSGPAGEPVWTFRGYELRPGDFNTAMVHLYRAEISRSNMWRQRLDNTTNWAVITAGAGISFALSDPDHHYAAIILNTLLVTLFLWIEARRYRYYELWAHRTRLMETDFFAAMLAPPFRPRADWADNLTATLQAPEYPISMWEAFGRRFRRNYMWIFLVLALAWLFKVFIHPTPAASWNEIFTRLAFGPISGWAVLAAGLLYNGILFVIGLGTAGLQQASGEVLPEADEYPILTQLWQAMEVKDNAAKRSPATRSSRPRPSPSQQLLCLVISNQAKSIADRVIRELSRTVTAWRGQGMYSQQDRDVLMIAVTVSEMPSIKAMVKEEDPEAFVIVAPAQEILGRGFEKLAS